MLIRLIDARYVSDYTVWLRFNDKVEGEVNLQNELDGEVFEPLKDIKMFKKLEFNTDLHTLAWPNGADFAPEFLYELVQNQNKRKRKAA